MKKFVLIFLLNFFLIPFVTLKAQLIYLSTIPPYTGGNGSGMVTFNVKAKTNTIEIKELYCSYYTTSSSTTTIWYRTDSINGSPAVSAANGWIVAGTATFTPSPNGYGTMAYIPVSNLSITIPAGAVYGIALTVTANITIAYTGIGSSPTSPWMIYDNNIYINMGPSVGWGGTISSPIQYRQFNGKIGYVIHYASTDASLSAIITPGDSACSGNQNVSVKLKNYGPN